MRKLLILALLFALPLMAHATAETFEGSTTEVFVVVADENYLHVLRVLNADSMDIEEPDTTRALKFNPLLDYPVPDNISIYWTGAETGTGMADGGHDTLFIAIDVATTNLVKASADWVPLTQTAGSLTYASRTGKTDSLTNTADDNALVSYSFTSTMLAECLNYFRIRFGDATVDGVQDTVMTTMYVVYKWNNLVGGD